LAKRGGVQRQAYATAYKVTILGGTASLVVAMLMGFLLTRGVTVPITRMTNAMAALAKGDTGLEVPGVSRNDEIGAMAAAVQISETASSTAIGRKRRCRRVRRSGGRYSRTIRPCTSWWTPPGPSYP
jgi:HAMP domain-containing protein